MRSMVEGAARHCFRKKPVQDKPMVRTRDTAAQPADPRFETEIARLAVSIDHLTKAVERLDRDTSTLRSDARSDFRILFGAVITSTLGLAALIAKTAHWF